MNAIQVHHCCKFIGQAVFLVWGPSGSRSLEKDSLQIVHWWLSSKKHRWGVWESKTEKRRQPIKHVLLSQLLLWATRAQFLWGNPGKQSRTHNSESALLRRKGAGVLIRLLLLVIGGGFLPGGCWCYGTPSKESCSGPREWQLLAGAGSWKLIGVHGNGKSGDVVGVQTASSTT